MYSGKIAVPPGGGGLNKVNTSYICINYVNTLFPFTMCPLWFFVGVFLDEIQTSQCFATVYQIVGK
jgi:hypothetical protein